MSSGGAAVHRQDTGGEHQALGRVGGRGEHGERVVARGVVHPERVEAGRLGGGRHPLREGRAGRGRDPEGEHRRHEASAATRRATSAAAR